MKFSGFFQKLRGGGSFRKTKLPSKDDYSNYDLFYQVTYMSATAQAEIPRTQLFSLASSLACPIAKFFDKINLITKELAYDYSESCRTVGESVDMPDVKSLLLRFSNSLAAGEPLDDFMGREAQMKAASYENEYERDLESMRKWTDAYAALIVSVALVIIINAVSTLIYQISTSTMIGMAILAVGVGAMGSWIIWRSAPKETGKLTMPTGSQEQLLAQTFIRTLLPLAGVACLGLLVLRVPLGWIYILGGLLIFPLGIVGLLDQRHVTGKNEEFAFFIRTLGGLATSAGTTLTEALTRVNLRSFPSLGKDIERLKLRLLASIDPEVCWRRFRSETGSELINQGASMFYDSVILGGEPEKVGFFCSLYASQITGLQAKRNSVASTFVGLSFVMHGVVVTLMILIVEIVTAFLHVLEAQMTQGAMSFPLPVFSIGGLAHARALNQLVSPVIFLLTLTTALALKAAQGGQRNQLFFHLCILMLVTGLCSLAVPILANALFGGLAI
jgi:flagellar protein FlaJ